MIEVGRCAIVVRDVDTTTETFKKFERKYSIWNEVTHKYDYSVYTVIDSEVHIPATIGAELIQNFFPDKQIVENYASSANPGPVAYKVIHKPRTDDNGIQEASLNFLKEMKNNRYSRARMLTLKPGSGKTFVSIAAINYIGLKPMILVDTINLAEQWKNQFLYHTDLQESDIKILSGMKSIDEAKDGDYKVYIAMYRTLGMMLDKDQNAINDLNHKLHIGIRVFDECHENFHNACVINSLSNVNYSIYLTATPGRSEYKEDKLFNVVYHKVKKFDGIIDPSSKTKYHTVFCAHFNSHPTDAMLSKIKTKYGFSGMRWASYMASDECYDNFRYALMKILRSFKIMDSNAKVAIMIPTIELINKIQDSILEVYPDADIGRFIGEVKKDERESELDKKIILTNLKMCGKAIDIPGLDCVINLTPIGSKNEVDQLIGRLRNNPGHTHILIDIADYGFAETKQKQKIRITEYKKIAREVKNISNELNEN